MPRRQLPTRLLALPVTGPVAEYELVVEHWRSESLLADSSVQRLSEIAAAFASRLVMAGRPSLLKASLDDCDAFVRSTTRRGDPPSMSTLHLRRTALRAVYRTIELLGVSFHNPTVGLELPPRGTRGTRPLHDDEVALLRVGVTGVNAAIVAACGAGATTREVTQVTGRQLRSRGGVTRLDLPGSRRVRARTVELDPWAAAAIRRQRDGPDQPLVRLGGSAPGSQPAQASACNRLRRAFADCGLTADDIRPASLRLHAGAVTLRATGRIERAAAVLGLDSLDVTSHSLHYDWHTNEEYR